MNDYYSKPVRLNISFSSNYFQFLLEFSLKQFSLRNLPIYVFSFCNVQITRYIFVTKRRELFVSLESQESKVENHCFRVVG